MPRGRRPASFAYWKKLPSRYAWANITNKLNQISKEGPIYFSTSAETAADAIKRQVQENIKTMTDPKNKYSTYIDKKHNRPLVWTYKYYRSIKVIGEKKRRQVARKRFYYFEFDIGIEDWLYSSTPNSKGNARRPIPMFELAELLEFGGGNDVPPRPHWRPAFRWAEHNAIKECKANFKFAEFKRKNWDRT